MTNAEWIQSIGLKFSDLSTKEDWKRDGTCTLYIYKNTEHPTGTTMIDYCSITREEAANKDLILVWLDRQQDFLTEKERTYLKNLIPCLPHPDYLTNITKVEGEGTLCYLSFSWDDGKTMEMPTFDRSKMYKNLEIGEPYTLDELGIFSTED